MTDDLRAFAAAVAHDLRTPLSAMCGEVDLALRRERTPESYRDTLNRISTGLAELLDFTASLALVGDDIAAASPVARLDAVLASLAASYAGRTASVVSIPVSPSAQLVLGDPARLERALGLVLDHVLKHDRANDPVTLRLAAASPDASSPLVQLVIAAGSGSAVAVGSLRLRAAALVLQQYGGALDLTDAAAGRIEVHLQTIPPDPTGRPHDAR